MFFYVYTLPKNVKGRGGQVNETARDGYAVVCMRKHTFVVWQGG